MFVYIRNDDLDELTWCTAELNDNRIRFDGCKAEEFQPFEEFPVVQVPDYEEYRKLIETLEWYADSRNYHANGTPGRVLYDESLGLEVWESDRGKLAKKTLEELS